MLLRSRLVDRSRSLEMALFVRLHTMLAQALSFPR